MAGLNLLGDQRPRGSHKDDLGLGKPAVVVVHYDGSNKGLAKTCRDGDEGIVKESALNNVELVVADGVVGGVDPGGDGLLVYRVYALEVWGQGGDVLRFVGNVFLVVILNYQIVLLKGFE